MKYRIYLRTRYTNVLMQNSIKSLDNSRVLKRDSFANSKSLKYCIRKLESICIYSKQSKIAIC